MSYVIGFADDSKIQVSDGTGEKLKIILLEGKLTFFELAGEVFKTSSVMKVVTKQTAFDTWPKDWELLKNMEDTLTSEELKQLGSGQNQLES